MIRRWMLVVSLCTVLLVGCTSEEQWLSLNGKGLDAMEKGEYSNAVRYFLQASKETENDTPLTNLAWVHIELGEYEKALEYIEHAMDIGENSAEEYNNYGNALIGLEQYEEAAEVLEEGIGKHSEGLYLHYGLGVVYQWLGAYDDSVEAFQAELELDPEDPDNHYMVAMSLLNANRLDEAEAFLVKALETYTEYADLHIAQVKLYALREQYMEVLAWCVEHEGILEYDALSNYYKGLAHFELSDREMALNAFERSYQLDPDDLDTLDWYTWLLADQDHPDKAVAVIEETEDLFADQAMYWYIAGNVHYDITDYKTAAEKYQRAVNIHPEYEEAAVAAVSSLYAADRHIASGKLAGTYALQFPEKAGMLYWYKGLCEIELMEVEQAFQSLEVAHAKMPDNDDVMADIADLLYMQGDPEAAEDMIDQILEINPDNTRVQSLLHELELVNLSDHALLKYLFDEAYLFEKNTEREQQATALLRNTENGIKIISAAVDRWKQADDPYTYAYWGAEYEMFHNALADPVQVEERDDNLVYARWNIFLPQSDEWLIDAIDRIEQPEKKVLVLDMRGNAGGVTDSAANILDALLPVGETVSMEFRSGEPYKFWSDASVVPFKRILVLTDGYTASAGEMVALGLQELHENAQVVGQATYGKGVGQKIFEDPEEAFGIAIVNHYWLIGETNIHKTGVQPDILTETDDLTAMLQAAGL